MMYFVKQKVQTQNRVAIPQDVVNKLDLKVGQDIWIGIDESSLVLTFEPPKNQILATNSSSAVMSYLKKVNKKMDKILEGDEDDAGD